MPTLEDVKKYLRIDNDEEDSLVVSLIATAKEIVEDVLRKSLEEFEEMPVTIKQAFLYVVATLYENRQIDKSSGVSIQELHDTLRRLLFAYRDNTRW